MSDYEMLSLILMILGIIVTVLIAYINQTKKQPPSAKVCGYFFVNLKSLEQPLIGSVFFYFYFFKDQLFVKSTLFFPSYFSS